MTSPGDLGEREELAYCPEWVTPLGLRSRGEGPAGGKGVCTSPPPPPPTQHALQEVSPLAHVPQCGNVVSVHQCACINVSDCVEVFFFGHMTCGILAP